MLLVSIHTPTKGVTPKICSCSRRVVVSIHTPTKGVTLWIPIRIGYCKFQSTHPRRVWPMQDRLDALKFQFQSTHPRRVWLLIRIYDKCRERFQSTHPRRVWLSCCPGSSPRLSFNPHTHEGCDNKLVKEGQLSEVSIHTPTKGVTRCARKRDR